MTKQEFYIDANPAVWWPVSVSTPHPQGPVTQTFRAKIAILSEEAYDELFSEKAGDKPAAEQTLKDILARNARLLPKIVLDWELKNSAGENVSISSLAAILTGPYGRSISIGLNRAVNEVRYGLPATDDNEPESQNEKN